MRVDKIKITKQISLLSGICVLSLLCQLCFGICHLYAQEDLERLKESYFEKDRYSDFVDYLKGLRRKKPKLAASISYHIALTRYRQLRYLEETKNWEEYFSFGNDYRKELAREIKNTIDSTSAKDSIHIYARSLFWQFHKDQRDGLEDSAREDLINAITGYVKKNRDIEPIRYAADLLSSYNEVSHAKKLYNIYAQRLIELETDQEKLKEAALDAYHKGNLSLSAMIYDAYIERVAKSYPQRELVPILISIAEDFSYPGCVYLSSIVSGAKGYTCSGGSVTAKEEGFYDAEYAQKLFREIEQIGGRVAFDERLRYLRACNLEKSRKYLDAEKQFIILVEDYPQSKYYDHALYKIGLIKTYILKDISAGRLYFERLSKRPILSAQVISSIYQLGILSQWQKDFSKAKEYYLKLIEEAGSDFLDMRELTTERLKELDEYAGRMEYNLKTFLDVSFSKGQEIAFDMSQIDLKTKPTKLLKGKTVDISAMAYLPGTGCMAVEVKYLWSGALGDSKPSADQREFSTSYTYPGTKSINLVVVTPSGILDRGFIIVDVE